MNARIVKGFQEFVGANAAKRVRIRNIIEREFFAYGFEFAESPIIEREDFVAPEGNNDEAVRDVFRLEDRGKRKLALRYEFTFQLKRLAKNQKLPFKRFQIGQLFRDEPIRKGRVREFTQCDADVVGSFMKDEVECLKIGKNVFEKLGIPVKIFFNNRKLINEILVSEGIEEKNRDQVIREIDKLDKLSKKDVADNLKRIDCERVLKFFIGDEKNLEKYKFYNEIREFRKMCKMYGVEAIFRPFLARGLSYYNGTVFEVWSDELGVSLCGGGSYLVDGIQSTGISFGLEPLFLLSKVKGRRVDFLVLSLNEDVLAIDLADKLREKGFSVLLLTDKAIGKGLEYADSNGIGKVVFVGKNEVSAGRFKVRDMVSGEEKMLEEDEVLNLFCND